MDIVRRLREKRPLVHCITNYVTANDVANAILACGGSPVMADSPEEAAEITSAGDVLVLNTGTLSRDRAEAMMKSAEAAVRKGIPVILDPAGVGASEFRRAFVSRLLSAVRISVIRGNLSEICCVAGHHVREKGVDSSAEEKEDIVRTAALCAADRYRCLVTVTGAEDLVTDGSRIAVIRNGSPVMGKITGTGCMLSGILGAYAAAEEDLFFAAVSAAVSMGIAGEEAEARFGTVGTGSMRMGIIDALSRMDDEMLGKKGRVFLNVL